MRNWLAIPYACKRLPQHFHICDLTSYNKNLIMVVKQVLLCLFYRWGNWLREIVIGLTTLNRARIQILMSLTSPYHRKL